MASVDRAMAKAAAALLPGLLPTPPRSTSAPCFVILPASFASKPKPGRADSVERWDTHKKDKEHGSPSSSSCGSSSPGRASSCQRSDNNKRIPRSSSSSSWGSSTSSGEASSCERWESNKRPPSRASCPGRWDTHKKSRSAQADAESRTGKQKAREINVTEPPQHGDETTAMVPAPAAPRTGPVFSGPNFVASPDPSMLPMPTFCRSRGP